jgi:hypothetical protein
MAGAFRKRARIYRNSGTTIPIGPGDGLVTSAALVQLPNVLLDNDNMAAGGALYIRTAGIWIVAGMTEWYPNGQAGYRTHVIYEATAGRRVGIDQKPGYQVLSTYTSVISMEFLDVGARLETRVVQSSGQNCSMGVEWYSCTMAAILLGDSG